MAAALVQSKQTAVNTPTATNAATWDTPATTGNTIGVIVAGDDYITAPNRPSGFTFSTGMGQESFHGLYLFWKVASGGETSASYTLSSAAVSAWITFEISGLTPSPYDTSNGQFATSSGGTYTTPAITVATGDAFLLAAIGGSLGIGGALDLGTWLNSFTEARDVNTSGAPSIVVGLATRAVTGDGVTTFSSGATYNTNTPQARTGLIISFKVATASAGISWMPQVVTAGFESPVYIPTGGSWPR